MAGTLSSMVNSILRTALALFLTPLVVHSIGLQSYGLWAVVGGSITYLALFDGGVGSGFIRHLAEFLERRQHEQVRQVVTFGLSFYLGLGLLLVPAVYVMAPHIVGYLKISPSYNRIAVNLLTLAVGYFAISNALGIFGAFIAAMQLTYVSELIGTIYQAIYAVSLVALLHRHYGIYALPAAIYSALVCTTIIRVVLVYRLFGNPWSSPARWDRQVIRRLFSFGFWMQVNALTAVINLETDRIILGTFVSVTSVGYYELGNKIASLARMLPGAVLGPLLPAASAIDARNDQRRLDAMYVRATRYQALGTFLVAGFLIGAGKQVLMVWMGQTYPYVTIIMTALLVSFAINNLTGAGTMIVRATAQPHYETYYAVLGAVINIIATLILTPFFGIMGVVSGTLIGIVAGSLYFLWLFHNLRGLGWKATIIDWLWKVTAGIFTSTALTWIVCSKILPLTWFASRIQGVVALGGLGMVYLGVSLTMLWVLGFWIPDDLALLRRLAGRTGRIFEPSPAPSA
jgi:O-antigen/teichoic acid export membrane protein